MLKGSIAFSIQWHITTKCINRCKHCYMFDESYCEEHCSFEDFVSQFCNVGSFFKKYEMDLPSFVLTGGSPLSHPDAEAILTYLKDRGIKSITLLDIPEVLTEKKIEFLKSVNVTDYQMSLDGMQAVHDDIRGAGSFDRTIAAVRLLANAGIRPHIMFTLGEYNKNQLLPLCEYLYNTLDCFSFAFDFVVPIGSAKHTSDYLTVKEAEDVLERYHQFSETYSSISKSFQKKPSQYRIYEQLKRNEPVKTIQDYPMISGCHIGWDSICILQNGDVLPCRRLPIVLGNLNELSFEDIFLGSELLRKFRRFYLFQKTCGTCKYGIACRGCPAISYALSGDCFESFNLCSYQSDVKYVPNHHIPDFDCSNLEELSYIRSAMPSYFLSHPIHSSPIFPQMVKYIKSYRLNQSKDEREAWIKKHVKQMSIEEADCFMRLLYMGK